MNQRHETDRYHFPIPDGDRGRCKCGKEFGDECHQSGNNMNQATWPALREYIGAEIALSHARRDFSEAETDEDRRAHAERVGKLQEQSTRMETAFRESLP